MNLTTITPRFSGVTIQESDWNPRYDSAMVKVELDPKDFKALMPKHLRSARDFELTIDRQGAVEMETFWPGSGQRFKPKFEELVPLLQKICSGNYADVNVLGHPRAYKHIEAALERFDRALTAFGLKQADATNAQQ